jgi:hypothetical protein
MSRSCFGAADRASAIEPGAEILDAHVLSVSPVLKFVLTRTAHNRGTISYVFLFLGHRSSP